MKDIYSKGDCKEFKSLRLKFFAPEAYSSRPLLTSTNAIACQPTVPRLLCLAPRGTGEWITLIRSGSAGYTMLHVCFIRSCADLSRTKHTKQTQNRLDRDVQRCSGKVLGVLPPQTSASAQGLPKSDATQDLFVGYPNPFGNVGLERVERRLSHRPRVTVRHGHGRHVHKTHRFKAIDVRLVRHCQFWWLGQFDICAASGC